MLGVLTNLSKVMISQCICISDHHVIYLKLMLSHVNYVSLKLKKSSIQVRCLYCGLIVAIGLLLIELLPSHSDHEFSVLIVWLHKPLWTLISDTGLNVPAMSLALPSSQSLPSFAYHARLSSWMLNSWPAVLVWTQVYVALKYD